MLKFFNLIIDPINKLFSSPGFLNILKTSPLIIIPVLLYMLGSQYLQQVNEQDSKRNEIDKISKVLEANPELNRPVSYYLLRTSNEAYRDYLNVYLDALDHFGGEDSIYTLAAAADAFEFVTNLRGLFKDSYEGHLAHQYFLSSAPSINEHLIALVLIEAEKYDKKGIDKVTELLLLPEFSEKKNCTSYEQVLVPFLEQNKVRKSTIRKIFKCKDDK